MNKYKEALEQRLKTENIKCPDCGYEHIGIDNWNMFEGDRDWFLYCKKCDYTFK